MTESSQPVAERPVATPAPAAAPAPERAARDKRKAPPRREPHPLLHRLAEWHPALFGARFRPLKLGIYEDLLAAHPELKKEDLKAALAFHARSTPYLECVASGEPRSDLQGEPVEPVSPEHRLHAVLEVYRRRQARAPRDLQPWLLERLTQAIAASGLDRDAYLEHAHVSDPTLLQAICDAYTLLRERGAKREALRRAFQASGRGVEEFAQMYGMDVDAVRAAVEVAPAAAG